MSGPTPEKAQIGVPDRWMYCPKIGKVVENLFVPFKTPLCGLYDDQVEPKWRFHPEDVFNAVKGKKIGLWIDLTKTDRFYFVNEVERHDCQYRKLKMEGHGAAPSVDEISRFSKLVHGFVRDHPGELVAVHCTHGFNRTGFAIVAYLVNMLDWAVDAAVQTFSACRPNGIYKQDYMDELFQRYGDMDDLIEAPPKPQWEYGESTSIDESANGSASTSAANGGPNIPNASNGKLFMDGLVKGVYLVTDKVKKNMLQYKIKELCRAKRDGFPGLQPVSLEESPERNNLKFLAEQEYMVSWKADGMRYMVYICGEDQVYAFDRDNEVFFIEGLDFPHRKEPRSVQNALVDAEMIIEKYVEDGISKERPRLLIYDIVHFENMHVGKEKFSIRLQCIEHELIKPRNLAFQKGTCDYNKQPMSVRLKNFWPISTISKLFSDDFRKNLGHEIDGLIFQPVNAPYTPGRCDIVLKWKPPSHNSIDFKLQIRKVVKAGEIPKHVAYLYVQHQNDPFAEMKATRTLLPYDNKIIECTLEITVKNGAQYGEWKFMRERTDKSLPNSFKTASAVLNSMRYPVDEQKLCRFIAQYGYREKKRPAEGSGLHEEPPKKKIHIRF